MNNLQPESSTSEDHAEANKSTGTSPPRYKFRTRTWPADMVAMIERIVDEQRDEPRPWHWDSPGTGLWRMAHLGVFDEDFGVEQIDDRTYGSERL